MARRNQNTFLKRQKEIERVRKAKEKMDRRHGKISAVEDPGEIAVSDEVPRDEEGVALADEPSQDPGEVAASDDVPRDEEGVALPDDPSQDPDGESATDTSPDH